MLLVHTIIISPLLAALVSCMYAVCALQSCCCNSRSCGGEITTTAKDDRPRAMLVDLTRRTIVVTSVHDQSCMRFTQVNVVHHCIIMYVYVRNLHCVDACIPLIL